MPNVHVLATCKNDSLWPYTVLFLKTIRVGFPTARIIVTANGLSPSQNERLKAGADKINAQVRIDRLEHPEWIQTRFGFAIQTSSFTNRWRIGGSARGYPVI